ncbi:hypothetical protein F2Q69_00058478 [Brassica cretica]|uniref:Uncharacterized protein n=1 Tax=Brassica cretica TaxID=69181 RepID=A0A8S9RHI9_BRACR|nr:hypothetical protein F2Q69_00058478 [Brassica cretica]
MKRNAFRSEFKRECKGGPFRGLTGCYVASWRSDRSLCSEWRARSLHSDRVWLELGRYIAIEFGLSSVAT